jgi:hypothetical protein
MIRIILLLILLVPFGALGETIITDSTTTSTVTSDSNNKTQITSPPPSAIAPAFLTSNSDLCTVGTSASIQTQLFGIAGGTVFTEPECVLLKRAKLLWSFNMRISALALLCSAPDGNVHLAMQRSGTPCPAGRGLIGDEAQAYWDAHPEEIPGYKGNPDTKEWSDDDKSTAVGTGGIIGMFVLLLLFI